MTIGRVIRSFASPSASPTGLTWDGRTLWHNDSTTDTICQIDPVSGRVIRSFASPSTFPTGLTWDGRTLWNCDAAMDTIYQIEVE